jgi:hypothetical protein
MCPELGIIKGSAVSTDAGPVFVEDLRPLRDLIYWPSEGGSYAKLLKVQKCYYEGTCEFLSEHGRLLTALQQRVLTDGGTAVAESLLLQRGYVTLLSPGGESFLAEVNLLRTAAPFYAVITTAGRYASGHYSLIS